MSLGASEARSPSPDRTPPRHPEAERLVLGAILRDNAQLEELVGYLTPEDFYVPAHRRVFAAMLELFTRGDPIDTVTISEEIGYEHLDEIGGIGFLAQLFEETPAGTDTGHYAGIVKEKSVRRRLIHVATRLAAECFESERDVFTLIGEAEKELLTLVRADGELGTRRLNELLKDAIRAIEHFYKAKTPVSGLSTGFYDLDELTNGLHPKDLIIVAGRPAMGKTAFTLNLAHNVAERTGRAVLIFSLEMGADQLVRRLLTARARVDGNKLQKGILDADAWNRIIEAADALDALPIYIDDEAALTVPLILSKTRRLAARLQRQDPENPLGLVIIDYLQLMAGHQRTERREQEISAISRGLKLMARELNIPVVALSQLNRGVEARSDKRPMLSDLRESGAIEQDADLIMFLYRDVVYNPDTADPNVAELIIGKQRNGPTGTIKLYFRPEYTLFENLEAQHVPAEPEVDPYSL